MHEDRVEQLQKTRQELRRLRAMMGLIGGKMLEVSESRLEDLEGSDEEY